MIRLVCWWAIFNLSAFALVAMDDFGQEDRAPIENVLTQFMTSWNEKKCEGLGAIYHEDAQFINVKGSIFTGAAEIETRHRFILSDFLKDSHFTNTDHWLKRLAKDVVNVNVLWLLKNYREPSEDKELPGHERTGVFTHIFLKRNNAWKIIHSQNTIHPG